MSLSRALADLPSDRHTEDVVRDVLALFGHHEREWLGESEIGRRTGHTPAEVAPVLHTLAGSYVLGFDTDSKRYCYSRDVALDYEIDAFMRRVAYHHSHTRTNVERFRGRQAF